ncbi:uncharacterized protein LOC111037658 [Myzus persicae]|uniref:uncharacterized protein LOC111037658 n=1 Tax=Myzus persicae TaxID=13164 RepID=UPI000B93280D|nr:uncharacterized protein LOC111037658 [Myzus persicae]
MAFLLNNGSIKVLKKICLITITANLYTIFSLLVPSCPMLMVGRNIYPFDVQFFESSILFMTGASIIIVECRVWPKNMKPKNQIIHFFGELYIMTTCIMLVYILFWHPIVVIVSIFTDKCSLLTNQWLGSTNLYKKSIPICMGNIRSTKFLCILLGTLLLYNALDKFGVKDL